MIQLRLHRKFKGEKYTIGDLFIDGKFFCNTIEDTVRQLPPICPNTPKWIACRCKGKVYAETAIPFGTYKVTMDVSPKFKRVLPRLQNVPHFIGILIHAGTTEKSSAGCIIVGQNTVKGKVLQSKETLEKLLVILGSDDSITITIQ